MSLWNPPTEPANPALQHPWLYFGAGVALAIGLHVGMGLSVSLAAWLANTDLVHRSLGPEWGRQWGELATAVWTMWWMGLSVAQLLYLGPAWALTRTWRPPAAQGVLVVAVITFLLQGSCYAFFLAVLA